MALEKNVKQDDGVTTTYHRILFLSHTINSHISIAVLSYVDRESRMIEKEGSMFGPYVKSITYETAYDESMTIEKAYEYLKTLPEFEGAVDI